MVRQLITHFIAALLAALALSVAAAPAVDANQASQAELETVTGIGPAMSGKILAARQQAKFKDWPDLLTRVSGLGDKNAQRISGAGLTVGGAAYAAMAAAPAADKPAKAVRAPKSEQVSSSGRPSKAEPK